MNPEDERKDISRKWGSQPFCSLSAVAAISFPRGETAAFLAPEAFQCLLSPLLFIP